MGRARQQARAVARAAALGPRAAPRSLLELPDDVLDELCARLDAASARRMRLVHRAAFAWRPALLERFWVHAVFAPAFAASPLRSRAIALSVNDPRMVGLLPALARVPPSSAATPPPPPPPPPQPPLRELRLTAGLGAGILSEPSLDARERPPWLLAWSPCTGSDVDRSWLGHALKTADCVSVYARNRALPAEFHLERALPPLAATLRRLDVTSSTDQITTALLGAFTRLRELRLLGTYSALAPSAFAGMTKLRRLHLVDMVFGAETSAPLGHVHSTRLEHLTLCGGDEHILELTDATARALDRFAGSLTALDVSFTSGEPLVFGHLKRLTALEARHCPSLTAEHLAAIAPQLVRLDVSGSSNVREHVLDGATRLQQLDVCGMRLCGAPFEHVGALRALSLLDGDERLAHTALRRLTRLTSLSCPRTTSLTNSALRGLGALQHLDIAFATDLTATVFHTLTALCTLRVTGCEFVRDSSFTGLTRLEALDCSQCTGLRSADAFEGLDSLTRLLCDATYIVGIPHLPALRVLSARNCAWLEANAFSLASRTLASLDVAGSKVTSDTLLPLRALTRLDVSSVDALEDLAFLRAMPSLTELSFRRSDVHLSALSVAGLRKLCHSLATVNVSD